MIGKDSPSADPPRGRPKALSGMRELPIAIIEGDGEEFFASSPLWGLIDFSLDKAKIAQRLTDGEHHGAAAKKATSLS
jgi:hypothetical protein